MFEINCGDLSTKLPKAISSYITKNSENIINNTRLNAVSQRPRKNDSEEKLEIIYSLPFGECVYKYNDYLITIIINRYDVVDIQYDGGSKFHTEIILKINLLKNDTKKEKEILEEFLNVCKSYYIDNIYDRNNNEDKISVFIFDEGWWELLEKFPKRKLDTLCLDNKQYDILKDMKTFLSKEGEDRYRKRGIPYKKNYLFEGPPGTGKTSTIYSLASELNLNLCMLNFDHETTDAAFMKALRKMNENCILVLEDIDVLFQARKKGDDHKNSMTFSGLINTLDGLAHHDKLIIIMTTNYKCHLDRALRRPGRIDRELNFDYATETQIKSMYMNFIENDNEFDTFYKKVKHLKISTAQLSQYLFANEEEDSILKNIDEFIKNVNESLEDDRKVSMMYN